MTLILEAFVLAGLVTLIAALLVFARQRYGGDEDQVVAAINQCLPQTQCAQCGHPGCLPYAKAIAQGEAINRCPPGGSATIKALAELLGREALPLDEEYGVETARTIAVIREDECIGCTLCIHACPVDAIIGAPQLMHSVLTDVCTGCDLCLPPCPVDCIDMIEVATPNIETKVLRPLIQQQETECIRCGDCEIACPKNLAPQNLFWQRQSMDAMDDLNLSACIECRLCDRVCPSAIPLTQYFIEAKQTFRLAEQRETEAELAETRFNKHEARLEASTRIIKTKPSDDDRRALLERLGK
jgi:electron transport complex protein RnfB